MFDPDYEGDIDAQGFEDSATIRRDTDQRDLEQLVALYDGEVAMFDMFLGRLLQQLKPRSLWNETMVIVTADHGDEFFEHGHKGHRRQVVLTIPKRLRPYFRTERSLLGERPGSRTIELPL
jgi:arylsulfatase